MACMLRDMVRKGSDELMICSSIKGNPVGLHTNCAAVLLSMMYRVARTP